MPTSLPQLITEDHVVLGASPASWQDAIREAAAPLLASESIGGGYVERMIEVVDRFGPYIVLAPGVALAHAQPDGSVARTAMSALTIPGGIAFSHEENDPVRLVLCLAAADATSHLEALKGFVQIIRDPSAVDRLVAAHSPADFRGALTPAPVD
ncbi:PTS sugar transporter subunit IIA [Brachybacterium sp. ACRRE]|uniref:PTS sugar transporter subunit IIA n=1 Tax=Brachybacterium sp. ACRRE TaxID=2918184 RepID=UPI001EF33845|nr:PTS sugar transporter subunit IIA [Brachybacterium sp. ACRRE]